MHTMQMTSVSLHKILNTGGRRAALPYVKVHNIIMPFSPTTAEHYRLTVAPVHHTGSYLGSNDPLYNGALAPFFTLSSSAFDRHYVCVQYFIYTIVHWSLFALCSSALSLITLVPHTLLSYLINLSFWQILRFHYTLMPAVYIQFFETTFKPVIRTVGSGGLYLFAEPKRSG